MRSMSQLLWLTVGCATVSLLIATVASSPAWAQKEEVQQQVAALKQKLTTSQQSLRQYEWIETTVVSHKGEEKSRQQSRCYYDVSGNLQKVEESSNGGGGRKPRGLRGRVVEKKTEDMTDYMAMAAALVQEYVPPDPARIQAVVDAGKLSVTPQAGGSKIRLDLHDFYKAGDVFSFELDPETSQIFSAAVATFFDDSRDPVNLDVEFSTLPDGTIYTSATHLDAPAKSVTVEVSNGGHRPTG